MPETVLIFDEAESRAATEAQMLQTARRFGIGGATDGPTTSVGGPHGAPIPPQQFEADAPLISGPIHELAPPWTAAVTDHLLLTPTSRPDMVRLVRMRGAQKVGSWTMAADAAVTVAAILAAFGISLTDLRETEEEAHG